MAILQFMFLPFLACLVLIGIHAYFGIHVLRREIIFVDLALAQIAALGGMTAVFFHRNPNSWFGYSLSLLATFLGALILAYTRHRDQKVPQEAYIGIVYAVATAAGILLSDKAPEGAEHVKEMLAGVILWVTGKTILVDAVVYAAVGLLHLLLFRYFWAISRDYEGARQRGIRVRWWDFVFYASFGIVVTLSVRVAGVLLVFCFLVIPSVISALFWEGFARRLIAAYIIGTVITILGLTASWVYDLPSGPTVAVAFGLALVGAHAIIRVLAPGGRWTPLRRSLAFASGAVLAVVLFLAMALQVSGSRPGVQRESGMIEGNGSAEAVPADRRVPLADLLHHLFEAPPEERETIFRQILRSYPRPPRPLRELHLSMKDNFWDRYYGNRLRLVWGDSRAVLGLCDLLADVDVATMGARQNLVELLRQQFDVHLKYDPLLITPDAAQTAAQECRTQVRPALR